VPSHDILGGLVQVYKRGGRFWHCSASLNGRQYRVTTKEEGLPQAKQFAEDWFLELRGKSRAGLLKTEKTFAEAAEQFLKEYGVITEGQRSPKWVDGHGIRLRLHLLPFFGKFGLSEITPGQVQEYRVHRLTTPPAPNEPEPVAGPKGGKRPPPRRTTKSPARSTLHDEIVTLRQVLKTAIRHNWLSYLHDFSPPYRTQGKIVHRPWFSPEEYKQLYTATRQYAHDSKGKHYQWDAEQVHDYVLFLANTGLRPDEAKNLQHRDVTIAKDHATGERILEIEVRGKRGVGYCKSMPSAVLPYERSLNRAKFVAKGRRSRRKNANEQAPQIPLTYPEPTDHLFPGDHKKLFNGVLTRAGLKVSRDGQSRVAYSLRHTYICMRLMEGADIYQIAKNCRTSVEMIEKFYAAHIKNTLDAAAINVMRPRAARQPTVVSKEADGDQPAKSKRNRFRKTRRQDDGDQKIQP
jgi:integrase